MNNRRIILPAAVILLLVGGAAACSLAGVTVNLPNKDISTSASGTIETDTVRIAPELAGKVDAILTQKGEAVTAGTTLFTLDDDLLQAKYDQAKAQVSQASAAVDVAKQNLESAQSQYQTVLDSSRTQGGTVEADSWKDSSLSAIDLPNWYFQKSESIDAAQAEVDAAQSALEDEQQSLDETLKSASNQDFVEAEARVNRAQAAFEVADQTLSQANASVSSDREPLTDAAQKIYDQAQTELDAAQKSYNAMLTGTSATDVKEARARVAAAQARLENAQDALNDLLTRDDSHQVENARIAVDAAQDAETQAEANLTAAQAAQREIEVELSKLTVTAPVSGVVLSNPVKAGETVSAGTTVLEIGPLDEVKLTVYVTEDQFGNVNLGDSADVTVDSFPGETFTGVVNYISDEAEFTPRNTQTEESRSTTVYAVEIKLDNPDHELKPGMPADAVIH